VLGGIGAVSLFVAALGITNTMVMSIYERTREIGVMKVLGAELPVIKKLFLFEAGMIGFFGGLLGLVLSYLISWLVNSVGVSLFNIGWGETTGGISFIPLWLSGAALVFATVVGIAAGFYPALRAMHLSALEAIRNE
jgi:ABC-type antimicrobial peptide transport system permease subunit